MKPYTREYQGHIYSDLEYVVIDPELLGDFVREIHPADFYSALDGITRHKIGSQYFKTTDGKYRLKIGETRVYDQLPEFIVTCSYITTPEEEGRNTSLHSWSLLDYPGMASCIGMDQLLEKIKECVRMVADDRTFKAMSFHEKVEHMRSKYPYVTALNNF